ncbi:MAG: hypothetical protein HY565_04810, partial [Candidatus Kerfeldbacteria bacterium]|nr:hypothetical protein [Candidatus Kerfeldbacteria bacterium]
PDTTEQKLAAFLEDKGREWMLEHIGHHPEKHFRRADPGVDNHFYRMEHPTEGDNRQNRVLVDRS